MSLFKYGDSVYIKTDTQQFERMITGITYRGNQISYLVSLADMPEISCLEIELSHEKNIVKTLN